jgi:hypothetical protein
MSLLGYAVNKIRINNIMLMATVETIIWAEATIL